MKGFPKYINTKADLDNLINLYPQETKQYVQTLINTKDNWFPIELIGDGLTDDTHKVYVDPETQEKTQYELREDPNGPLFRLGFGSIKEAKDFIGA